MLTQKWYKQRPKGVEYENEIELTLVKAWLPSDRIVEHDVLMKDNVAYIVIYNEQLLAYIAYPLGGHLIPSRHIDEEMEIYENIFDYYIKYEDHRNLLPIIWPYKTFEKNLEFYLNNAGYSIYR